MDRLIAVISFIGFGILFLIMTPHIFDIQESEVTTKVWLNYNDDEIFIPNVHYSEPARRVERGFPDFWNIKTVYSYVVGIYKNGNEVYYTIVTNVDTMEYKILNY